MTDQPIRFNEQDFADDAACGAVSSARLAAKYGLSRSEVVRILRGQCRPRIGRLIAEAAEANRFRVRRRLTALQDKAVTTLLAGMRKGKGEPSSAALAIAKHVLDPLLRASAAPEVAAPSRTALGRDTIGLSPAASKRIFRDLDGPED